MLRAFAEAQRWGPHPNTEGPEQRTGACLCGTPRLLTIKVFADFQAKRSQELESCLTYSLYGNGWGVIVDYLTGKYPRKSYAVFDLEE